MVAFQSFLWKLDVFFSFDSFEQFSKNFRILMEICYFPSKVSEYPTVTNRKFIHLNKAIQLFQEFDK